MSNKEQRKFFESRFFSASWGASAGHNSVWRDEYKEETIIKIVAKVIASEE
ncbi:hypothetical protein ABK01_09470 [Treponema sp. OMZ 305]|uniref:hypothetical protein n=1 Tax=Treponema sp. OMZ 305 TaxID=1659192 RepID=UPI0020A4F032|nr:hypothetical protein [Treponema sp. OMZ 305]UTC58472.1 hypothetical protein ABK01_09470 [Treponema sp. OMZ 305]